MARILTVKVQARSRAPGVEAAGPDEFRVRVRAAPEKGRANKEAAERLAAHLGLPPSRLTLVGGAASSRKRFRVEG
ncbi:MAG TPA: DUF167 domain-containing protein [Candidatus Aminicenantes bacterium]|nr:DUF167 domain-containing protein [Candidatus Aminicenantes bacterium]